MTTADCYLLLARCITTGDLATAEQAKESLLVLLYGPEWWKRTGEYAGLPKRARRLLRRVVRRANSLSKAQVIWRAGR